MLKPVDPESLRVDNDQEPVDASKLAKLLAELDLPETIAVPRLEPSSENYPDLVEHLRLRFRSAVELVLNDVPPEPGLSWGRQQSDDYAQPIAYGLGQRPRGRFARPGLKVNVRKGHTSGETRDLQKFVTDRWLFSIVGPVQKSGVNVAMTQSITFEEQSERRKGSDESSDKLTIMVGADLQLSPLAAAFGYQKLDLSPSQFRRADIREVPPGVIALVNYDPPSPTSYKAVALATYALEKLAESNLEPLAA